MDFPCEGPSLSKMKALFGFIVAILLAQSALAQVEHNYPVGPNTVTCDSIDWKAMTKQQIMASLSDETFRFSQQIKVNASKGFQGAQYYSCNNASGYLIIKQDGRYILYSNVEKIYWDKLVSSKDPAGHYYNSFFELMEIKD